MHLDVLSCTHRCFRKLASGFIADKNQGNIGNVVSPILLTIHVDIEQGSK